MNEEFHALMSQNTWTLVPSPQDTNILGWKWMFKKKYNADGSLARYKAKLVAQGYNQLEGVDYHETFSLVAKLTTLPIFITVTTYHLWPIIQLDVSNAFLHGQVSEHVYM